MRYKRTKPKNIFFISVIKYLYLFSLLLSCSPTESVFKDQKITLQADAGVTEAWLTLSAEPIKSNALYTVKRDTSLIFKGKLNKNDTLLYDSGLKPDENYKYTAYAELNGERSPAVSAEIVTMDTTGHDFSWTTYEFGGQGGSSAFYDVAIIDENDIWAVGEIYTKDTYTYDSLGNWIDPYNAAYWDGEKWELKRIYWNYQNNKSWSPIYSIISFNLNDVWFGIGSLIHWDGKIFKSYKVPESVFPSKINKIWGTSSENLYIVGNSGLIAHYDGQSWTKIESGTDLPIQDIWGSKDERTGEYEILCVASRPLYDNGKKLLKIEGNSTREINSEGLSWSLRGLWFKANRKYIIVGDGYYESNNYNKVWKRSYNFPRKYKRAVVAKKINDIIICGSYSLLMHFNGYTWKYYYDKINGWYNSSDIKGNTAVSVGSDGRKAYIVHGKR